MSTSVHGINIAVKDLESATARFEAFFGVERTRLSGEAFAFPNLLGNSLDLDGFVLNLITSDDSTTSVGKFLERQGEGFFLLSLLVDDVDQEIERLEEQGITPLLDPSARGDFGAANFLHPKQMHGIQIELLQLPPDSRE